MGLDNNAARRGRTELAHPVSRRQQRKMDRVRRKRTIFGPLQGIRRQVQRDADRDARVATFTWYGARRKVDTS